MGLLLCLLHHLHLLLLLHHLVLLWLLCKICRYCVDMLLSRRHLLQQINSIRPLHVGAGSGAAVHGRTVRHRNHLALHHRWRW